MRPRGSFVRAGMQMRARPGSRIVLAATLLALAAGCSRAPTSSPQPTGSGTQSAKVTDCGTTKTAANVPVKVEVVQGQVPCGTAMRIEKDYANAIDQGQAPGNGGGGPVHVKGWTCEGFATPEVLKTGNASKCVEHGKEILAVLPIPA